MPDTIENLGDSLVQHGAHSDRVYLMRLDKADLPGIVERIDALAQERGYSKIFVKVPAAAGDAFRGRGYEVEATIPAFFNGEEDALFMARYPDPKRKEGAPRQKIEEVLAACRARGGAEAPPALDPGLKAAHLEPRHADEVAALYRKVFDTYPFPIHDPAYIAKTMGEGFAYFGVYDGQRLVAASSAEMDLAGAYSEMTDFATLPECRGKGLATILLGLMEDFVRPKGVRTAFTIARAVSFGMNIAFARVGYSFGGTLWNNTNISGNIESMNIWHKRLDR
ncbi:MAG: putative beta-lysine N-acetyltransferase, partial [Elusimicrobiota bacterium]